MRNRRWKKTKVNQVLILEKWMELQQHLISDLGRIQASDWKQAKPFDQTEAFETLGRIRSKIQFNESPSDCTTCGTETGDYCTTDAKGQVWSRLCTECEPGRRRIEARKLAAVRAAGDKSLSPAPE